MLPSNKKGFRAGHSVLRRNIPLKEPANQSHATYSAGSPARTARKEGFRFSPGRLRIHREQRGDVYDVIPTFRSAVFRSDHNSGGISFPHQPNAPRDIRLHRNNALLDQRRQMPANAINVSNLERGSHFTNRWCIALGTLISDELEELRLAASQVLHRGPCIRL